jgi:phage I-like protein
VAAYGAVACVPGDGLFLDDLQWTPHGQKFAREYVDLSPTPARTDDGTVIGVHSVALCRHGAIEGLQFYSVEIPEGGNAMDWKKWLCAWMDVNAETATDEEVTAAFGNKIKGLSAEAIGAAQTEMKKLIDGLTARVPENATATITALSAELSTLKGLVVALEKGVAERDRQEIVRQAAIEGKVIPLSAEQLAATDLTTLREMVGKLAVTVPVSQRTPVIVALSAEAAVTSAVDFVARACGMDPRQVK